MFDPALIRTAIDQARQTALQNDSLRAANDRTIRTLETALNQALNVPSNEASNGASMVSLGRDGHRRSHRAGVPPRISSDPELEAFIRSRIDGLTFTQIIAEVAAAFPPDRRTILSALSRWWKVHRQIPPDPN